MSKKITTSAFVAGAAIGTTAGLMSKKKNRQRVIRAAKKAKTKLESLAEGGIDFTKDKIAELRKTD